MSQHSEFFFSKENVQKYVLSSDHIESDRLISELKDL